MYRSSKILTRSYFALLILSASTAMASTPMDTGDDTEYYTRPAPADLGREARRTLRGIILDDITEVVDDITILVNRIRRDLGSPDDEMMR